jgi:cytoskeleton protein RodZ
LASQPSSTVLEAGATSASSSAVAAQAPVIAAPDAVAGAVTSIAATTQVVPPLSGDLLVFKAKSTAWVRVSDAKGAVQFEKTLAGGETASASGVLPLAIVVGNVAATELLVRGQAFNLEEVAKNNIARFEVK